MLCAMPEDQAQNVVPGTVHGNVAQVGAVHGNVHIHQPASPAERPFDLALRIASELTDPALRLETMVAMIKELRDHAPERAEQVVQHITDPDDRAAEQASLALGLAENHPGHALRLAEPVLGSADNHTWLCAVVAIALADPGRAGVLMSEVDNRAPLDPALLARLAAARHPVNPADAARLADRAEQAALDGEDRDLDLLHVAGHIARYDARRASAIIHRISPAWWRSGTSWAHDIRSAVRAQALAMIDAVAHAVVTDDDRELLAITAAGIDSWRAEHLLARIEDPARRVRTLADMASEVAVDDPALAETWLHQAMEQAASNSLRVVVAQAAADVDPQLSVRAARLVSENLGNDAHYGTAALIDGAACLATVYPAHAQQLLDEVATVPEHLRAEFTAVGIDVAAALIADDPLAALRAVDRIEIPYGPQHDWTRIRVVGVLTRIAEALAVWNTGHAKEVLHRAERELRAARSIEDRNVLLQAWYDLAMELVQLDPAAVARLAAQHTGDIRNDLVAALSTVDPAAAERVARSITDPVSRDNALATVAVTACESRTA
jgi:hypothetical protein